MFKKKKKKQKQTKKKKPEYINKLYKCKELLKDKINKYNKK